MRVIDGDSDLKNRSVMDGCGGSQRTILATMVTRWVFSLGILVAVDIAMTQQDGYVNCLVVTVAPSHVVGPLPG